MLFNSYILRCKYCGVFSHLKQISTNPNYQVLSDLLGISTAEAVSYVNRNNLRKKDTQQLAETIKYCLSLGYNNDEILLTPMLMRKHPRAIEQNYLSMKEGGFVNITPDVLARAISYMKRNVCSLKQEEIIPEETDVAKSFVDHIIDKQVAEKVYKYYPDEKPWNMIHLNILKSFLMWRLSASEDEIISLFRIHKMIRNKSFYVIQENIAMAEDLGFEPRKIIKYGYLLSAYPKYTKTILQDFPDLAGIDMRKAMRHYPKLFMTPPSNIVKIYGILKEFQIPDDVIRRKPNVFHMSPDTVKVRLEAIQSDPDLRVLLNHPNILQLIIHHKKAKTRLSFLQHLQLRCASLSIIGADTNKVFDEYVRRGKDVNSPNELIMFLKCLFDKVDPTLKDRLKRHPYYLQVPFRDMQETYDYLVKCRFHPEQIYKVIHILLYPRVKIDSVVKKLKAGNVPNVNYNQLAQVNKLNVIMYMLEKEHHFTGNGIWINDRTEVHPEIPGRPHTEITDS